jgi:hypothetical protein
MRPKRRKKHTGRGGNSYVASRHSYVRSKKNVNKTDGSSISSMPKHHHSKCLMRYAVIEARGHHFIDVDALDAPTLDC